MTCRAWRCRVLAGILRAWAASGASWGGIIYVGVFGSGLAPYVVDEPRGTPKLLTAGPVDAAPAWSPVGSTIAFLSVCDDVPAGYLMNAGGSDQRRFVGMPGDVASLDGAPDGWRIVFDRLVGYQHRLSILSILTGESRDIEGTVGAEPQWSSDVEWITFSGAAHVSALRVDGTGLRWTTTQIGRNAPPGWSPDGAGIVYQADDLGRTRSASSAR